MYLGQLTVIHVNITYLLI